MQAAQDFVPDQLLVRFRAGAPKDVQDKLLARYGLKVKSEIPQIETKVVSVNPKALDAVINALSHNPAVAFAEKDRVASPETVVPNDPDYTGGLTPYDNQWPFKITGTNNAWDKTTGVPSTVVAVLDTGIDLKQPDLGTMVSPWSVPRNNTDVSYVHPHGIYTSGVVNAHTNNAVGVASTCWNCSVEPIQISTASNGDASYSAMASGFIYAADHGAKIINISYGGAGTSNTLYSAENYAFNKDVMIFAAAGNGGCNCPGSPAADPGVIGVAAVSNADYQGYSSYGSWVPIGAPTGVATTWATGSTVDGGQPYGPVGGTSISSPFAAGVAGLLRSAQPQATTSQIKQTIFNTADQIGTDANGRFTQYGRINAYKAMTTLVGDFTLSPPDTTPPTAKFTAPLANATLTGQQVITVDATDNAAVSRVDIYWDGYYNSIGFMTSTNTAPYTFYFDTTKLTNGSHRLCTKATDTSLNGGGACVTVNVKNDTVLDTTPPTATLTAPANGATVSNSVAVNATASDNVGITSTELYIDGLLRSSAQGATLAFTWDSTKETNGAHSLLIKAYDAAGNTGTSTTSTVTVSNTVPTSDTAAPTVTITQPANGSAVAGSVTIAGTAADNIGVTKMQVYVDSSLLGSSTTNSVQLKWNTRKVRAGSHTILIKAYDAAGNAGVAQISVVK
ncbi:MAG TPA: Ig-like domain-containing protein [Candidatus Saccharimonadales bacterium]|nr:Ig-like domain-containing protein [Candidatus Saccharimonadales bacterium]